MSTQADDAEFVYFNVNITNPLDSDEFQKLARYSETRVVPILNNPSQYSLSVIRFKIPSASIPLVVWEDGKYKLSITFDGETVSQDMTYTNPPDPYGVSIYQYTDIAEIFNTASISVFNALKVLKPALPGVPPRMVYDPVTSLYSVYYSETWEESLAAPPILAVNTAYVNFLPSLVLIFNDTGIGEDWIFNVKDTFTNTVTIGGVDYLKMTQEYPTLGVINQLSSLVIGTNKIPVTNEYLSGTKELGTSSSNLTRAILTDFEPLQDVGDQTYFQFFVSGPLRHYQLQNTDPLRNIDFQVFWEDNTGTVYPLYIQQGEAMDIKLQFTRNSIIKHTQ